MKLSEYFTLEEMVKSQTASRLAIDNSPSYESLQSMAFLCKNILDPVRVQFGKPFSPSSGYRSVELNRAIGGSQTSSHCSGSAVDFEVPGISNLAVANFVLDNLDFDQLILEFYDGSPNSGWIHASVLSKVDASASSSNRKEALVYNGWGYVNGFPEEDY
jgi:zinc D-Ala-D-Ala carboxypeptidase|tara:strand:+ start:711 stop:1190 length:480 start_codon:yes stop_codon:yes gene_type:complete